MYIFLWTIPLKTETQKLIEEERQSEFLVIYFHFLNLKLEMKEHETFLPKKKQKKTVSTSEWCEKHLPPTSLPLWVLHFSFLNTLCSFSIISECVSHRDCLKKKREKKNKTGHTTVKHRWLKLQGHFEEWEKRGEKEMLSGMSVSIQHGVCSTKTLNKRSSSNRWTIHS